MTVAFYTLGCKVNQVDSGAMARRCEEAGYVCVPAEACPDVIVLNSCAVTAEAARKTRQKLRHFRHALPDSVVALTGCAVQVSADPARDYPEADLLLGHADAADLPRYIVDFFLSKRQVISISPHQRGESFGDSVCETVRTRANIKIEDGCDRFCAYCIIPHARGRVRSKPLAALREEVQSLAHSGFREVVLVGINLAAYGTDLGCDLGDAVLAVAEISRDTPIKRIRLGSLEPDQMTGALLDKLSRAKSLCPHFHLSLQSGCDRTLARMNRNYTSVEYFNVANRLRSLFPGAALTTDIMVGFPGETRADFEESLSFAESVGFANMHVFPFSRRPGTPAAGFAQQVPKAEKQARAKETLSLAEALRRDFLHSNIEKTMEVLLEESAGGQLHGYSANYAPVRVAGGPELRGQLVRVRVTGVEGDCCVGVIDC